jgi:hypothetical protein
MKADVKQSGRIRNTIYGEPTVLSIIVKHIVSSKLGGRLNMN